MDDIFDVWHYIDLVADFFFLIDVFVTCFSAYHDDDGVLITSNKEIFKSYLKGWFIVDIIASIPINLMDDVDLSASITAAKYK